MEDKKVMVSGCFDILHGGHIEFFSQAKKYGNYLIVSFANDDVLLKHKKRKSSIPTEHKKRLLESIFLIDKVVVGDSCDEDGLDFINHFNNLKPNFLISTEDDKFKDKKIDICLKSSWGCQYVCLEKTLNVEKVSTTDILNWIKSPKESPLRVDFAGGWLDVPKFSVNGGYIVNCAIQPLVSLTDWIYPIGSGLGGSAAYAYLTGKDSVKSELDLGVGWQDPAVIKETGLCVWRSGNTPILDFKINPDWLYGKMALLWSGNTHKTYEFVDNKRDFNLILKAGALAREACMSKSIDTLAKAIDTSYSVQLLEGMNKVEDFGIASKYCGGGFGGFILYLFNTKEDRDLHVKQNGMIAIEPYLDY
jgi:cytidyltransferase-like protein